MTYDLMAQFLTEAEEQIVQAESSLAILRRHRGDAKALDACFRAFHTLKGSTGLFDLAPMERVLHAAEDLLSGLRRASADVTVDVTSLVETVDLVSRWLDTLRRTGALPAEAEQAATLECARLKAIAPHANGAKPALAGSGPPPGWQVPPEFEGRGGIAIRYVPRADSYFMGDDPVALMAAVPGLCAVKVSPRDAWGALDDYDPYSCNLVLEALSTASRPDVEAALRFAADQVQIVEVLKDEAPDRSDADGALRTLRIEAARVDRLADLAEEFAIALNGLAELAAQVEGLPGGRALSQMMRTRQSHLDRLVADLHGTVGKVRLLPLNGVFTRFPRLVREIARALDKSVALEIAGGEIEVDKTIIDGIFEPLLHVVRNAVDHGVEDPAARARAGKPEIAVIRLTAHLAGDQVVIAVEDDGAGIDPVRMRDLAVARGVISQEAADALDDAGAIDLIFIPGFSSAGSISAVSGRGVGMDVVRDSAHQLGGRVAVSSRVGQGSSIRITLPVTRILARVMIVVCRGEHYGVALDHVVETLRIKAEQITPVRTGSAFRLRDQVIPLVSLGALVGVAEAAAAEGGVVMIAWVRGELVGFAVDKIVGRMTAAVRPMNGLLAGAPGVLGTCLVSNGTVLVVLDLPELLS